MPVRLKDYGRNQKKRKEYIHQSGLLLAGVDVIKGKHEACIGALEGVMPSGSRELFYVNLFDKILNRKGQKHPSVIILLCSIALVIIL